MQVTITQYDTPPPRPALTVSNIVAQPGGQTAATPLPGLRNIVTNVAAGAAVILQLRPEGFQTVFNACGTGLALPVFPPIGMTIKGASGPNVPMTVADGDAATFTWDNSVTWLVS